MKIYRIYIQLIINIFLLIWGTKLAIASNTSSLLPNFTALNSSFSGISKEDILHDEQIKYYHSQIDLLFKQKEYETALLNIEKAIKILYVEGMNTIPSKIILLEILNLKTSILKKLYDDSFPNGQKRLLHSIHTSEEIIQLIDDIRQSIDSNKEMLIFSEKVNPIFENIISIYHEAYKNHRQKKYLEKAFEISERQKAWIILQGLRKEVANNDFSKSIAPSGYGQNVSSIKEVQQSIDYNEALIEYFVGKKNIYAFLITKNEARIQKINLDFPLEKLVFEHKNSISQYYGDNQIIKFVNSSLNLYEKIIRPLGALPERLIIVPDGILGYISFDILILNKPSDILNFNVYNYLLNNHTISYSYSATILNEIKNKKIVSNAKPFLGIAPSFQDNGDRNYQAATNFLFPLLFNVPEIKSLQRVLGTGDLLIGKEATKKNFAAISKNYNIIHIATHASVNDRDPHLFFSKTNEKGQDYRLELDELYNMNFIAQLVVLSACETGLGKLQEGEGIMSISRGFTLAGARSLVASLWRTNDNISAGLMESFYRNLALGQKKDEALRNAKLTYLSNATNYNNHPFFWAGFVPFGNMDAISIQPKRNITIFQLAPVSSSPLIGLLFLVFIFLFKLLLRKEAAS